MVTEATALPHLTRVFMLERPFTCTPRGASCEWRRQIKSCDFRAGLQSAVVLDWVTVVASYPKESNDLYAGFSSACCVQRVERYQQPCPLSSKPCRESAYLINNNPHP